MNSSSEEKGKVEGQGVSKLFGKTIDSFRVGFQVRRGGRLLSGIEPKLWGLSTGMNRAKGLRAFIDLPVNNECDKDWCVTTFKNIWLREVASHCFS